MIQLFLMMLCVFAAVGIEQVVYNLWPKKRELKQGFSIAGKVWSK